MIDDPWIPLRWLDGGESLHSIRETLSDAHLFSAWFSGEPLFGAAAVRLLTAFMWRAHPELRDAQPADLMAARETAAAAGRCPQAALDAYCDQHRGRFWLLEPDGAPLRRFGQGHPSGVVPAGSSRVSAGQTGQHHETVDARVAFVSVGQPDDWPARP